jgi:hypothetical protein
MEYKFFHGKRHDRNVVWRNHRGRHIPLFYMTNKHIFNCLNCIAGIGEQTISDPYMGKSHEEWVEIFTTELNLRDNENQ